MNRIKITTEKYLSSLETAKLIVKWEKILDKCAPIDANLEVMHDHDYVKIFVAVKGINLEWQFTEKEKELYLTMESGELIRNSITNKPAYETPVYFLLGYLNHHDAHCQKFSNIMAAFEFIYMFSQVLAKQ